MDGMTALVDGWIIVSIIALLFKITSVDTHVRDAHRRIDKLQSRSK